MPLGGVTEELIQLRKALWSLEPTRSALREYYERLFAADITTYYFDEAAIKTIQCPTLVLWTDKNPIHGPEAAHRLHKIIQGSQLHVMEGCAHWPQWERPEEHDAGVNEFFKTLKITSGRLAKSDDHTRQTDKQNTGTTHLQNARPVKRTKSSYQSKE